MIKIFMGINDEGTMAIFEDDGGNIVKAGPEALEKSFWDAVYSGDAKAFVHPDLNVPFDELKKARLKLNFNYG